MRAKNASITLTVVLMVVSGRSAVADPPHWTFMDVKALFNTAEAFFPYGVNDLGQVTGSGVSSFNQGSPRGPFVTQPNSPVDWSSRPGNSPLNSTLFADQVVNGTYDNNPPNNNPDNTLYPVPYVVNNNGWTTGFAYSYPNAMPFLGSINSTISIGPTDHAGGGYAINDANQVAGYMGTDGGWLHAALISGGVRTDLGTFRTQPPTRDNDRSVAYAINDDGTVVGVAATDIFVPQFGTNQSHAFRWTQAEGLQDLGTLPGGHGSTAYDINDLGQVTGISDDGGFTSHAVVWSPSTITTIPNIDAQRVPVYGLFINDAGWVVGTASAPGGSIYFLYKDGQSYELLPLIIDDGTHWANLVITDMNDRGQLVGYGTNDNTPGGGRRVFLLTPDMGATSTTISLVGADATADRVRLRWYSSEQNLQARLYRRDARGDWSQTGILTSSDGTGMIAYEDTDVIPGHRYGYHLVVGRDGGETTFGEVWIDVPVSTALAIEGFRPNPARGIPTVSFVLPNAGPARIELLDLSGRRVATQQWSSLEGGRHVVRLSGADVRPGVHLVRLSFAGRSVSTKSLVLER